MIKSMTGFGRGEHVGATKYVVAEIRTVNHRYSEVIIKMPRQYSLLEEKVRRFLLNSLSRGRIEVFIKIENTGASAREVEVDKELAMAYYKALKDLAEITGTRMDISAINIAQLPDVLKIEQPEEDLDTIWQDIMPALREAYEHLLGMREKEGEKLQADLSARLRFVADVCSRIREKSPELPGIYRDKLQSRISEILENGVADENRIALEIAIFADKSNIDEELERMESHLVQFAQILDEKNAVGRKLDFLMQEMNREINTIGSKANDLGITQSVVELKSELEKLREQIQNVE